MIMSDNAEYEPLDAEKKRLKVELSRERSRRLKRQLRQHLGARKATGSRSRARANCNSSSSCTDTLPPVSCSSAPPSHISTPCSHSTATLFSDPDSPKTESPPSSSDSLSSNLSSLELSQHHPALDSSLPSAAPPRSPFIPRLSGTVSECAQVLVYRPLAILKCLVNLLKTSCQILWTATSFKPISYLVSLLLAICFALAIISRLYVVVSDAFSPYLEALCFLPGTSQLAVCPAIRTSTPSTPSLDRGPPFPEQLAASQYKISEILYNSTSINALPYAMWKSEPAISEIKFTIEHSDITSWDELLRDLDNFRTEAREARSSLIKFNSHVGGTTDEVLSITRSTLREINKIATRYEERSDTKTWIHGWILTPYLPTMFPSIASRSVDVYKSHFFWVKVSLSQLAEEGVQLRDKLADLEARLTHLQSLTKRDIVSINAQVGKVAGSSVKMKVWTALGGSSATLRALDQQIETLTKADVYWRAAKPTVDGTVLKLEEISSDLDIVKDRLNSKEIEKTWCGKPLLEAHIESIESGVERLAEQRSVHQRERQAFHENLEKARNG